MTFEDYFEIMQTIARYGHAIDSGDTPFDAVLTDDVALDLTAVGGEVEVRSKYLRLGQREPGPMPVLIGRYLDTLVRTPAGWRISRRAVIPHGP